MIGTLPEADLGDWTPGRRLARGVARFLTAGGHAVLAEVTLANGRRADLMALDQRGGIWIVEVKSSLADYLSDAKWQDYLPFCERFSFAVPADFPLDRLPEQAGLIIADPYGAAEARLSDARPMAAARRRALQLRFAHLAAQRLQALTDPEGRV
ncbi:MAG: MmcB family DNA repair protein [Pseudomonadota bacterium]